MKKGLYTTLDRDLEVVVNPQGTDASAYSFNLMNSANVDTELPFKDAVPFKGVLTRATSEMQYGYCLMTLSVMKILMMPERRTICCSRLMTVQNTLVSDCYFE